MTELSPTLQLACDLISRNSTTPEDAGCQQLMGERLAAVGFALEPLRFGEVDNLWARRGTAAPLVCFAGHTDVVPVGDIKGWTVEPFGGETIDGQIYGRGATDMKGSIAAFIAVVISALISGFAAAVTTPTGTEACRPLLR